VPGSNMAGLVEAVARFKPALGLSPTKPDPYKRSKGESSYKKNAKRKRKPRWRIPAPAFNKSFASAVPRGLPCDAA
jgi:hypothetical protein